MKREKADVMKNMQYVLNMRPVLNKDALFSDGSEYYRCPSEPMPGDTVKIRFRTQRNNVDAVYLVYGDVRQEMEIWSSFNGFDYYETQIKMGEDIFRYHFEVVYGWVTCYYTYQGVSVNSEERTEFEIYPGYHTPTWAKGAVMYQIFVDRFYNGDPSNDVATGEYSYIGDVSVHVDDWGKVPAVMGVREFYGGDLQGILDKLDYLPSELNAAYLYAQLEVCDQIQDKRMEIWNYYHRELEALEKEGKITRPVIPEGCIHNAHMYYLKVRDMEVRTKLIHYLREKGICSVFHYIPLHTAPAGQKFGRFAGEDRYTTKESERLLRLPMFYNLDMKDVEYVTEQLKSFKEY